MKSLIKWLLTSIGWPLRVGTTWLPHGAPIVRYSMYEKLKTVIDDPSKGAGKKALTIGYSSTLLQVMGLEKAELVEANYPEHNATNLHSFPSGEFDYVVSDQVLEHVEGNPQDVFDESLRLLKPGGIAVHTTVFLFPVHGYPSDFWRFTPACLSMLAKKFGNIVEVGGSGNRIMWVMDIFGLHDCPVPHAKWHPVHMAATRNSGIWPCTTWIVAKK